jgi:glycine betaine/choline ABC-type transport system substrate-binding protein
MDLGLLYTALLQKHVSMIASNTTDGMLNKFDVKVLKDDKHAFPPYQACIVVRSDTLAAVPNLRKILSELSGKIPEKTMRSMNFAVDAEHKQVRDVARGFLQQAGLL